MYINLTSLLLEVLVPSQQHLYHMNLRWTLLKQWGDRRVEMGKFSSVNHINVNAQLRLVWPEEQLRDGLMQLTEYCPVPTVSRERKMCLTYPALRRSWRRSTSPRLMLSWPPSVLTTSSPSPPAPTLLLLSPTVTSAARSLPLLISTNLARIISWKLMICWQHHSWTSVFRLK